MAKSFKAGLFFEPLLFCIFANLPINQWQTMKKIYHLSTCSTCKRILSEIHGGAGFELQDIKTEPITPDQLQTMHDLAGSYEALFSRRAMKYRQLGLNEQELRETDYRDWILKEYTFLKRPVIILDDQIFVGSAKKELEALKKALA
jgi:arsenate reductase